MSLVLAAFDGRQNTLGHTEYIQRAYQPEACKRHRAACWRTPLAASSDAMNPVSCRVAGKIEEASVDNGHQLWILVVSSDHLLLTPKTR